MMGWFLSSASCHWADSQVRERHRALTGVGGVYLRQFPRDVEIDFSL